jgi:hypothetical protein
MALIYEDNEIFVVLEPELLVTILKQEPDPEKALALIEETLKKAGFKK